MAPRRRCTVCGSHQWRREPATGLVVCGEGHVLRNYLNETLEAHEPGPHLLQKRALKSARERRGRASKANRQRRHQWAPLKALASQPFTEVDLSNIVYYGARARYLYFQCLQLLLRKQVAALIRIWKLPSEFEIICRDLWALHLSLLPSPPPPEPLLHKQATRGRPSDGGSKSVDSKKNKKSSPTADDKNAAGMEKISPGQSNANTASESDSDEDSDMDELLFLFSESSLSEDDGGDDDSRQPLPKPEGSGQKFDTFARNGPASNVALLVVACWTLRLPIIYMDMIRFDDGILGRLIECYDLPYLEPLHHLPESMVRHLTKHNVQALSPLHAPTTLALHSLSARLARKLLGTYKIHTPELNAGPMLWRVVRALGGTPVLYKLSKTLGHVLSLPLVLHHTLAPRLAQSKDEDGDSHKYDNVPPELALVVAVVIVLKMVYGLDGRPRIAKNSADPACALPRMKDYLAIVQEIKEAYVNSKDVLFSARSVLQVSDLDETRLDEYLDFCQNGLLRPGTTSRVLEDFFLLGPDPVQAEAVETTAVDRVESDHHTMARGTADSENHEPGEGYAIYRSRDSLGTIPEEYQMVISYGAKWIGVEEEMLLKVSERYERRLGNWSASATRLPLRD
ncbi:hypothetical protein EDB92DRAFT_2005820 [Lactarius akahatsu]|uniref:RRN7-type domain-containing protein n=1 Tax=Lactarius akahatsu TaxID=416441 RepID=A0AAD4QBU8_9AGAM|nr:hypothetical protein EDB92DRAFT_2005820 [Lactarius akahatsu]